jgi:hypothetical protein
VLLSEASRRYGLHISAVQTAAPSLRVLLRLLLLPPPPLPPAGKALDCASVGVYTLDQGSGMAGLMLSTEYDTPGAE